MAQAMLAAMEANTQRQTEIWQQAMSAAQRHWSTTIQDAGRIAAALGVGGRCEASLTDHTDNLIRLEETAEPGGRSTTGSSGISSAVGIAARTAEPNMLSWSDTAKSSRKPCRRPGEVINLEKALNQNLRALAGAKNFEDTVMSLSAAIHLLSSRLSKPLPRDAQVRLEATAEERAA